MINDLSTDIPTYKYMYDMTFYTVTNDPNDGKLHMTDDIVLIWSGENHKNINSFKIKEMLVSFRRPSPDVASITIDGCPIERVESVLLL